MRQRVFAVISSAAFLFVLGYGFSLLPRPDATADQHSTMTNGERWARICAVEYERGSQQDRKNCVTMHALQFAVERDAEQHQQRLKAARE